MSNSNILPNGIFVWLWPKITWNSLDPDKIGPQLRDLGITGVIPQNGTATLNWLTDEKIKKFASYGLKVCIGFGLDSRLTSLDKKADAIIQALDKKKIHGDNVAGVMLNWETYWDGKQAEAKQVVDRVLAKHPDAYKYCVDAPWWAPLFIINHDGNKINTHPSAPTREWGVLCANDRYVQAYGGNGKPGENDGRSTGMLKWARHPSQYASLGTWTIRPAYQAYNRSLNDQIKTILADDVVCLWDVPEWDTNCINALRVVKKLKDLGFVGPDAVKTFQAKNGLVADGIVGPRTLAALGLQLT